MARILVVGSSGFVGAAVCTSLGERGHEAIRLRTPRIDPVTLRPNPSSIASLRAHLNNCAAVVNAAGVPDSTGAKKAEMWAANGILPGLLASECSRYGVRFVHVSSAAVQGRISSLDSTTEMNPFSAYSASKARGEVEALRCDSTVIYRPPGVHGFDRKVTRTIARLARSQFTSVAGDGSANSPQALIENVGDAIAFLAVSNVTPPAIVAHPSEGVTTGGLLEDLGGRRPARVSPRLARAAVAAAFGAAQTLPSAAGHARRLEMLWFGQSQSPSWLTGEGWVPVLGRDAWRDLGRRLAIEIPSEGN